MWPEEATKTGGKDITHRFSQCCDKGKLTILPAVRFPPTPLSDLFNQTADSSSHFFNNIRAYNSIFQMASSTAEFNGLPLSPGISQVRINGEIHHLFGSALPQPGDEPKFAQIYILDEQQVIESLQIESFI